MKILLVDDDQMHRESIVEFLEGNLGHSVTESCNAKQALEIFKRNPFPMVLTDIRMPGGNGIKLLKEIKSLPEGRETDAVIITGYGDMNTAIAALRAGAYEYLQKPIDVEELASVVERIAEHQALLKENYELTHRFREKVGEQTRRTIRKLKRLESAYAEIVGVGRMGVFSSQMQEIVETAKLFHQSRSLTVLIEGETGTGKELVARLVHYGPESNVTTPFITLNCSAIPPNLFESELFGYEAGAFTGAKKSGQMGKLELAQDGTLLLDEIGDMSLELQPKLLRVLQERKFYRVGGLKKIDIDTRIICATNQNLDRMVNEGLFRKDLFFRLNMGRIQIPPLRGRREDIAPLAQMFLERFAKQKNRRFKLIQKEALQILENYPWPGNVRELENMIERVVLLCDDVEIKPEHLKYFTSKEENFEGGRPQATCLREGSIVIPPDGLNLEAIEAEIIRKSLLMFNGNKTKAAAYLGISRSTLRSRLRKALRQ